MQNKSSVNRSENLRRERVTRYSIRKYSFGAASVAVAALFMFLGNGAVSADELGKQDVTAIEKTIEDKASQDGEKIVQPDASATEVTSKPEENVVAQSESASKPEESAKPTPTLDKSQLESYITEIEGKISAGKYANKTEESLALLNSELSSAKSVLASATSQDELKAAYNKLVTVVSSKLKNKPVEKTEAPKVDTTNGKETVGKKAENTEPSAANSHAIPADAEEGAGFRRNDSGSPQVTNTVDYRDAAYNHRRGVTSADTTLSGPGTNGKTVVVTVATPGGVTKTYETVVTNGKWTVNLEAPLKSGSDPHNKVAEETKITVQYKGENNKLNDDTRVYLGRPKFVNDTVVAGQKEVLVKVPKDANNLWVGFEGSWDRQVVMNGGNPQSQDTSTLTAAMADTQDDPIFHTVKLTFLQNVIKEGANGINLQAQSGYSAAGGAQPGTTEAAEAKRLTLTATNEAPTIAATDNGSDVVVKKGEAFDIATLATVADKEDDAKLTVGDPVKAKLVSVNGASATTFNTATPGEYTLVLKAVDSQGKDSGNTITRKVIVRDNQAPTAEIPFSDPAPNKKEVFVYGAEENSFDIKIKDDSGKIVSATVRGGSNQEFKPVAGEANKINTQYGYTANTFSAETTASEDSPAVITYSGTPAPEGTFTLDKLKAATKGENPEGVALGWRYVRATDADGGEITGNGTSAADIGAFRVMLKPQTQKYDIQSLADSDKVVVTDPSAVTDDEFNKIKEKLKLEYSKTNPDKNLEAKRGQEVAEKDERIDTITKVGTDLVVTYKDGSVDKKPLSEFVNLNKQPAIDAVNKAAEDKIAEINKTPNATDEEKAAAIAKVNADKEKAVAAINDANVATKAELEKAKEAGTTAIAADNPVVAKKDAAKADVEAERKAKADAINADTNLSQAEKDAAIAKINKAAEDATKAIDAATTDADVDTAKNAGTTEFGKVNPIAKENAKEAIANALTAKNKEIDARTDLTQAEKDTAKAEAKKLADAELAKVEAQPDNAETADAAAAAQKIVNDAEDKGVADVTSVHPIAKEQAKQAVADELTKKEAEIDARDDLTQEEKDAAKKEAQDKAKAATDAINAQPAITDSADKATAAQQAVDTAKNTGVSEVKAVNPEAAKKPVAKKAIDDALKAKEEAIDARTDLSDKEKAAAKLAAKNLADAAKKAIDNATTDAEVEAAQTTGTDNIATVNPVAKEAAKQAVADELTKKEAEIDARDDLTQEEKDAAKKEAQDKAKAATDAINAQPDTVDTPEEATAAQQAVDAAKDKGVADVKAVNPEAKAKPAAKKAIDEALKAKEAEIDARTDLTDEEKTAAKEEATAAADKAKENVDKATTDAAVKEAENAGVSEVKAVNPEAKAKPAAKKAIDEALKAKEAEIDARTDLTDEEKAAAKEEAKAVADKAKENVDKATTDAAVKEAETAGTSAVKAINPEAKAKPVAKKAIDDKLAEQLKAIENTPDATDEEKKVAADAARAIAEQAKKEIDAAKSDADVKALEDEAKAEIEKSLPLVEDKPNARKAIDEEAKAKKAEIDARNDLSSKAKEALKAKVDKVANKAKAAIDAVSSVEDVNVIEEADKAAIKAIGDINRPIDKVLVKDPSALTDEEKAKILEEVKRVNPTAKEVKYNENGKIEVTTGNGDKGTINPAKLVKTEEDLDNGKGGNDINKPLDKVIVKDPANLTDEEKAKIVAKVEEVNPDAIVTIDENGTVSVSTPDGKTSAIPASDLVRTKEDTEKAGAGNSNIVKPADKVVGEANDPDDQAKAEEKLRELNPETKSVKFDENGNATVTLKDGTTATIPAEDLFRSETDITKPNAGNDIVKPADKTLVKDPNALTDEEKVAIAAKVKEVNPDSTVVIDDKGNATVTTPEGKTAVIPGKDLVKTEADAAKPNAGNDVVKPADKTLVKDPNALTDEEKAAIAAKVKEVNPDSTVVIDDKGNATVTTKDGKTAVIPGKDLVKTEADAAKPNAGNDIVKPADKTLVKDPTKLTDEEKSAIAAKVKEVNPDATVVVDDKGNATVTTKDGKTAVIPGKDLVKTEADASKPNAGNDIVKPADKTLVKDPAKLTDEEKSAIAAKVQEVNPDATVVVDDKGNVTVTTKDGKTAVIPGKDLVKTEADASKPNAGNDIVKPADKTLVKDPAKLTDEEKAAIAAKVQEVNPDAIVVVDDKGNATVTTKDGKTAVIPGKDLVKTEADAAKPNAGNDIVKPADKTLVKDPTKLTDEEKSAIAAKVKEVNPDSTVVIDDKGNATVTTKDGKTAVIPGKDLVKTEADAAKPNAGNDVVKPTDKTLVKDPAKLTDEEKAAIAAKVKEVNPDSTVVVDDKGNATVTTKDGKTAVIPAKDLVKTEADLVQDKAGNDINTPAVKTTVANKDALTDAEKEAVKKAVEAVNPGATVVVDDKGNATVTTPEGKTAVIPASKLVIPTEKLADLSEQSGVNIPAARTLVADKNNLTPEEIAKIKVAVEAVNPGAIVVVDAKGNATVTTLSGKTATISAEQLIKDATDVAAKNNGENINLNFDKQVVADLDNLTDADKEGAKAKILTANPDVAEVIFDEEGNATVVLKDGKVFTILAKDIFMKLTPAPKASFEGNNKPNLVDKSKLSVLKGRLEEWTKRTQSLALEDLDTANKALEQAKSVLVDPNASQADVQDAIRVIEEILNSSQNKSNVQSDQTRTETPVATQDAQTPAAAPAQAANANQEATNARTVAKELPNTGTADSVAFMVAAAASAVLGLGLAGRRRKEDEEA